MYLCYFNFNFLINIFYNINLNLQMTFFKIKFVLHHFTLANHLMTSIIYNINTISIYPLF